MGYVRKLTPLSEKKRLKNELSEPEKFWVCDIESYQWINFVTIGLTNGEEFQHFEDLGAFFEYLTLDGQNKVVYAHFGGKFDFLFLLNFLFFSSDWRVENMIPRGSGLLTFDAICDMGNGRQLKITFRDSSAMLPFGLKSLTKNFKVESLKQEWDHSKTTKEATPELIKYCEYDCRGLHQVISKYQSWPIIKSAGAAPTIAGQALKVLRTFLEVDISSLNPRVDEFVRRAYFGGRTEVFKPLFDGPGMLKCWDVNSLYPTVMREPPKVGEIPQEYPAKFKEFTWDYDPSAIAFFEAEVEVPEDLYVPPLGVVWEIDKQKKFIFPTGRFIGCWSTLELEYAKTLGVKVLKTGKGAVFHSGGNFFRRYVDELYEIRERSERESVDNVLAKLLLNSCYGRFGLRTDRENLIVDQGQLGVMESEDESFLIKNGDLSVRLVREPKQIETFNNVAVSAWVTSASRVFMHRIYMRNPELLYYTDTDSLFTKASFQDEKGLGGLKLEYEASGACFLLPKTYVAEGIPEKYKMKKKVTMKGFDKKKISHFTVEDFVTALEGDLRRLRVTQDAKFATFKTALQKRKILTMLPESAREIRSMYDKRVVFKLENQKYDTRPHFIENNEPIVTDRGKKKETEMMVALLSGADLDEVRV